MIALEPIVSAIAPLAEPELEFLLLGDLRQLLDEPPTRENRRWLLAVLDRLLAGRAGWHTIGFGPESRWAGSSRELLTGELISQLQRLRDRVAHGASFQGAAQDVRVGLKPVMSSAQGDKTSCSSDDATPGLLTTRQLQRAL